jgi:hypothetical protein
LLQAGFQNIHRGTIWSSHELTTFKRPESFERPSTILVKHSVSSVPTITNTSRNLLTIKSVVELEEEFKCLSLAEEELNLFGTKPLAKISEEHVVFLPQHNAEEMHSSLPWEAELTVSLVTRGG